MGKSLDEIAIQLKECNKKVQLYMLLMVLLKHDFRGHLKN